MDNELLDMLYELMLEDIAELEDSLLCYLQL